MSQREQGIDAMLKEWQGHPEPTLDWPLARGGVLPVGSIVFGPLPPVDANVRTCEPVFDIEAIKATVKRAISNFQQDASGRKWDKRFLELANLVATWSKDPSSQVAAVLVDDHKRIVSLGFNGEPKGVAPSINREQKLMRTIHAEANALHFAGRDVEGCTLYITHAPCAHCAAHAIQRGIKRVVFPHPPASFLERWGDSYAESLKMFQESGVSVSIVSGEVAGALRPMM